MHRIVAYILLSIVVVTGFISCIDRADNLDDLGHNTREVSILLSNPTLKKGNLSLRSMSESDENKIDEIDILAFKKHTNGDYIFSYRVKGYNYQELPISKFTTTLQQGDQTLAIITNASSELDNLINSASIGTELNTLLSEIVVQSATEWHANNNGLTETRYIPMFATIKANITTSTTSIGSSSDYLIRMLSRLDIKLKEDSYAGAEDGVNDFELIEACLFNRKDRGFVAYNDVSNYWNSSEQKAIKAYVPSTAITTKIPQTMYAATANKIERSIYTFEASGVKTIDLKKNATAIVVGGKFNSSPDITYYRIDIPPTEAGYYSGDILRNHLYNIIIQKVSKPGAQTPEDAFDGEYTLDVEIEDWTNIDEGTELDPQYYLYVSIPEILLSKATVGEKIIALTNHPEGIYLQNVPADFSVNGGSDGDSYRELTVKSSVSGNFILKAGNLRFTVKVR